MMNHKDGGHDHSGDDSATSRKPRKLGLAGQGFMSSARSKVSTDSRGSIGSSQRGVHHGSGSELEPKVSRAELIEQVMRMSNDDRLVIPFLDAVAGSTEILTATGRLLASPPSPFPLGTPLAVWVEPETRCEKMWRTLLPTRERSLWVDLEFLRAIVGDNSGSQEVRFCCPYEELEHLRLAAN